MSSITGTYRVEHISVKGQGEQHVVVDANGQLMQLPCKFLKYVRSVGKSANTQRAYAYALKEYSNYLASIGVNYLDADKQTIIGFTAWLQYPDLSDKVVPFLGAKPSRKPASVNNFVSGVLAFYRYLFEIDQYKINLWGDGGKSGNPERSPYKPFLYKFGYKRAGSGFSAYVKMPRVQVKCLSKNDVEKIIDATTNPRDRFLIYLLYISGLRIGEALSLHNQDIIYDPLNGHKVVLKYRGNLENGARLKTGERTVNVDQKCMDLFDDYEYYIEDKIKRDNDFVFITLWGQHPGKPMTYSDVMSIFKRLRKKTGINIHPHLLRHTNATILYMQTKDAQMVQNHLGHRQVQTTIGMYVHPSQEEITKEWKKAEDAYKLKHDSNEKGI